MNEFDEHKKIIPEKYYHMMMKPYLDIAQDSLSNLMNMHFEITSGWNEDDIDFIGNTLKDSIDYLIVKTKKKIKEQGEDGEDEK